MNRSKGSPGNPSEAVVVVDSIVVEVDAVVVVSSVVVVVSSVVVVVAGGEVVLVSDDVSPPPHALRIRRAAVTTATEVVFDLVKRRLFI